MMRQRGSKGFGTALVVGCLMAFSAILHPKGAEMENVQDETRRKKGAQSGEPVDGASLSEGGT